MDREPVTIRSGRPGDLDALYRVCVQTADNGQDGTALFSHPELPGQVYVGPYLTFEPALAFVAEDAAGVGGYIVAALDSRAFQDRLEQDWWPGLRDRYPEPSPAAAEHLSLQERRAIGNIHRHFGAPDAVIERFPSHLHINLVPRLQGRGTGRKLVAALTARLRADASAGLHLLVGESNARAIGFYRHIGFTELPTGGTPIFTMGLADRARPPGRQECGRL
ncbi:MAG: GNAT family N-acetyltransferase [Streptosporangiaceae bacterium]